MRIKVCFGESAFGKNLAYYCVFQINFIDIETLFCYNY